MAHWLRVLLLFSKDQHLVPSIHTGHLTQLITPAPWNQMHFGFRGHLCICAEEHGSVVSQFQKIHILRLSRWHLVALGTLLSHGTRCAYSHRLH